MSSNRFQNLLTVGLCYIFMVTGCTCTQSQNQKKSFDEPRLASSPEWVKDLGEKNQATQLFVVADVGKTTAYVSMHEKKADGSWVQITSTPGFIGKNGLGKTKEGDAKTPVGSFHFNYAFGIADDPGCKAFTYKKVDNNDYWSGDTRENYKYNQMVSIKELPDLNKDDSEHLIDYVYQYQYAMNIDYNEAGLAGLGSAIFLHGVGDQKTYTGGCIAIPHRNMIVVMQNVRKDCVVVIDELKNISPETYDKWGL